MFGRDRHAKSRYVRNLSGGGKFRRVCRPRIVGIRHETLGRWIDKRQMGRSTMCDAVVAQCVDLVVGEVEECS